MSPIVWRFDELNEFIIPPYAPDGVHGRGMKHFEELQDQ